MREILQLYLYSFQSQELRRFLQLFEGLLEKLSKMENGEPMKIFDVCF